VLDHRGLRRLFKDGARSLLASSVFCRSPTTEVVQVRPIPSSAWLLRAPRCVRPSRLVVLPTQLRSRDAASGGRRLVSTASHGVFKVCALAAGSLRDDSHRHGASNSGPLPPFGVPSFRSSLARIVAPLSASAARDRHPPRSCTFVKNSETRFDVTTSDLVSSCLSGAGLPFLPHRRAVLAVSHDLDSFAAHGLFYLRPPGLRTEPQSTASPQLASVPVGLPRATNSTEVVLVDVDLTNLALQAYFILQPIMGFAVFPVGGSVLPLTRAAPLPLRFLSHGAQSLRSLRSLGWCAHLLSRPRIRSP